MSDVFQLTAQLQHPEAGSLYSSCYCYNEPSLGIVAEPLVPITTAAIQYLLGGRHPMSVTDNDSDWCPPQQIQLTFSEEQSPDWDSGVVVELNFLDGDADGSTYAITPLSPQTSVVRALAAEQLYGHLECWLCIHLTDYFNKPPARFFCQITPA